ncbi:MAG: ABC transporter ATP-binding protein [Candidatus Omnitrophica bacterium]|nr:ABC transporter ATP-binding protein [Candidatus Omnitrophota bacterium]MDD5236861.1 ABC transporter ATP-binding protein [Candidatus Omnitrophota bacterium]MDD5610121.1 ABC transporter ATP-binding protein [Candidatus Omnitrophota bacterium]
MIEIREVSKSFNSHQVLNGLNLKIRDGETTVIIGRSGCGKSVLLKHIMRILMPDSGTIFIKGEEITKLKEKEMNRLRLKMGMVFQGGALFDSLSVGENVGFGLIENTDLDKGTIAKKVKESLELVGLGGIEDKEPAELSGGMRKRVALARAICLGPEIILYDEPTTGVDPITADSINDLIKNTRDKLGVTSIVVTHDMKSAYKVGDRIAMMFGGKIIKEGLVKEIQESSDPYVHQFINGLSIGPITETSL